MMNNNGDGTDLSKNAVGSLAEFSWFVSLKDMCLPSVLNVLEAVATMMPKTYLH